MAHQPPMTRRRKFLRVMGIVLAVVLGIVAAALVYAYFAPIPVSPAHPNPTSTYAQAVARINAELKADPAGTGFPSEFFGQGSKTATAVVLYHGLTNNPHQWRIIAAEYAKRGYNVWVPRQAQHGAKDRMADWLGALKVRDLTSYGDDSIDIAAGLGDNVEVVGLSGGATVAAWAAQNRDEVRSAVFIAPFFKPASTPLWQMKPLYQLTPWLPTIWMWWDNTNKANRASPPYSYPRFALAALSAYLAMADNVMHGTYASRTPLDTVTVITNGGDTEIDVDFARKAIDRTLGPHTVRFIDYKFPASFGYHHDIVSPEGDNKSSIPAIYRVLYPYLGLPASDAPTSPVAP